MSGPWDRGRDRMKSGPPRGDREAPRGRGAHGTREARDAGDARGPQAPRDVDASRSEGATDAHGAHAAHPARERGRELRLHGLNAVRAVFARRPEAIRKVYLAESRIPDLQPLLRHCVAQRIGYRVVAPEELVKLAAGTHHEGVVIDVLREDPLQLAAWLQTLPDGAQCLLWLDGVGNPHNLGAILRSAAHFGVAGVLVPADGGIALSGAAARVAEGGAEAVPLVHVDDDVAAVAALRGAGFTLAATVVSGGDDLFARPLPSRLVWVLGAEGDGMRTAFADTCDLRISIPGTGAVESLNVASATAVLLAQWRARGPGAA